MCSTCIVSSHQLGWSGGKAPQGGSVRPQSPRSHSRSNYGGLCHAIHTWSASCPLAYQPAWHMHTQTSPALPLPRPSHCYEQHGGGNTSPHNLHHFHPATKIKRKSLRRPHRPEACAVAVGVQLPALPVQLAVPVPQAALHRGTSGAASQMSAKGAGVLRGK